VIWGAGRLLVTAARRLTWAPFVPSLRTDASSCGNWCYTGHVSLDMKRVGLADIPSVIPVLQRQQNRLHYLCDAKRWNVVFVAKTRSRRVAPLSAQELVPLSMRRRSDQLTLLFMR
jgi:hypothetical protein